MIKPSDLNSQTKWSAGELRHKPTQYNNNNFYCFICVYYYSTCNVEIKLHSLNIGTSIS